MALGRGGGGEVAESYILICKQRGIRTEAGVETETAEPGLHLLILLALPR